MPIYVKDNQPEYIPAPARVHQLVFVDVIDLGVIERGFGPADTVEFRWQTAMKMPDGRPYLITERYTKSWAETSNLKKLLDSLRGRVHQKSELLKLDLESLIGENCLANVQHKPRKDPGRPPYAKVAAILPLPDKVKKIEPMDYVRVKAQETSSVVEAAEESYQQAFEDNDQDVPF